MRRSQADSTNRSLAAFGKLQHIPIRSYLALSQLCPESFTFGTACFDLRECA